jgi:hypothetical protein
MPLTATLTWQISKVDAAGFSTWPSLAFSPSGQAAIAFHSSHHRGLRFAELDAAGIWNCETVDTLNGESSPCLRYRFNQPAISYSAVFYPGGDTTSPVRGLNYALRRGGAPRWMITTAAPQGRDSSLAFDASKRAWISYQNADRALACAYAPHPSTWVGSVVQKPVAGAFSSLAFSPSGHPAIAYSVPAASGSPALIRFAAFDGTVWKLETIGEGDGWITLAFAPGGEPALTYDQRVSGVSHVIYAIRTGAGWSRKTLATDADSPSLAFAAAGTPGISYHDRAGASVKYAAFIDGDWQHFLVDQTGKDHDGLPTGDFALTSLAFSATGDPAISYYDRGSGYIKCAVGTVTLGPGGRWRGIPRGFDPDRRR